MRTEDYKEQFQQIFENSMIGMAIVDLRGNWLRANRSLCDMLGYSEQELIKLNVKDLTKPGDRERTDEILNRLITGDTPHAKLEKQYKHKDGHYIWVAIAVTLLYDTAGKPMHYVSQLEDITRRKEIEDDLLLSEKKYRTIFENVQDVFYQTDTKGIIKEISPSIELHSGYLRQEIIGRPVEDFYYYVEDRDRIVKELQTSGSVADFEVRLKTKTDELKYASVNARLVFENGQPVGGEGSMRDVTTRKFNENVLQALNLELAASNEQKNRLFSIIGHDLRNPISGSLQLANLILQDIRSNTVSEIESSLQLMKKELENASELLEDLLTWARAQLNAVDFNRVEIKDINELIVSSLQPVLPMAEKKHVKVEIKAAASASALNADRSMLKTIIRNLVTNAIKFTDAGGNVLIDVEARKSGTLFVVRDDGRGIPEEKLPQLFDRSFTYTTFGTLGEKGTGLGLDLCQGFVRKHGGEIWVESRLGEGSAFYFVIPRL
ncbi:PAS domain-containing sensor histidine kinase [Pedobacter sp. SYP-B3415]|uniref:PAS domain-containing sensor histidine kinase n=1 Tax=Pedobacter sp. SYP-B3415 TaxID=2496641 RepID=UPI0013EE0DB2|nr:PAS domain-containing sensor histidine kinase [Pedobacter sp. SYP-B3415]